MSDPIMPVPTIEKPSTRSEWTLIASLLCLCAFSLAMVAALIFKDWNTPVGSQIIDILGWGLKLSVGGILLIVVAINSPWYGVVKASGFGANLEIDGKDANLTLENKIK